MRVNLDRSFDDEIESRLPPALKIAGSGALGAGTPKSKGSDDMFRDDIFGLSYWSTEIGGICRFKKHFAGGYSKDVVPCHKVPAPVRDEIKEFMGKKKELKSIKTMEYLVSLQENLCIGQPATTEDQKDVIIAFDLTLEQFKQVPFPPNKYQFRFLNNLGQRLSIEDYSESLVNVWLMKYCGAERTWYKAAS
ncbi:hypothetical protein POM88_010347 [Heracleum sosnowskyi]|uniref:Uncharacterized protein n=1 Tax=Heracleum sosnowskyi TaxID=360622 RepID=A0AAD8N077_9APIA|nr:hypothetical protein POM88_010347 [Heracleum sosnowskyi]